MISINMAEILKPLYQTQLNYRFFIFFFFISFYSQAQEVSLKVFAKHYEDQKVYIWLEDDFFSRHTQLIDEGRILNGECRFLLTIKDISKIRIGIDYQYGSLYVEPNTDYEIAFPKHEEGENRSLAWNSKVMLSFLNLPEEDINSQIMLFNAELDSFFSTLLLGDLSDDPINASDSLAGLNQSNNLSARKFSQKESLMKFNVFIDSLISDSDTVSFISSYQKYAAASITFSLGEKKETLYSEYFKDKEIAYSNPEYVRFFNEFYQNFFEYFSYYPLSEKLDIALNSDDCKAELEKLVSEDEMSGGTQLKELVLLKGLYDYVTIHTKRDSAILAVIKEIAVGSEYPMHREIAVHFIEKLNHGKEGSLFPDIEFLSFTGDSLMFSHFKGQMIYLQIFSTWSSSSLAEMEFISQLNKKYSSDIRFISLSIDPDPEDFYRFVNANRNYNWELGWIGVHPEKLKLLSIYDLPIFYLIDEDLKIVEWPALWPSTGIEQTFYEMEVKKREENKLRFWEDQTNKSKREE